jgi:hypothetical protein
MSRGNLPYMLILDMLARWLGRGHRVGRVAGPRGPPAVGMEFKKKKTVERLERRSIRSCEKKVVLLLLVDFNCCCCCVPKEEVLYSVYSVACELRQQRAGIVMTDDHGV